MLIPNKFNGYSADGIRLYNCDGGSSGDVSSTPSAVTQTSLSYAPEVQPIVSGVLGGAAALAQQPYQPYQYQRIAAFDPMQLQAQQATANLAVSPYVNPAAQFAGGAAQAGLAGAYNPSLLAGPSFTAPGMAASYMSPYMQNVVDIGKREAARQAAIDRTQRGFQASRAGAYGGSRQAIMEAEANRNLMQQMGDIQARGSQAAYEQAAQQFQTEQARRLQASQLGMQTALQGAQQLGQLGQTQFGQAKDIIGLQAAAGAERQALQQKKLEQDYQDFLMQKKFPYQQAQYLMEMARGMPMTSTESIYKAPASPMAQLGSLASIYAGSKMAGIPLPFAKGGLTDLALYNMTR
jgi:hypothetical protein